MRLRRKPLLHLSGSNAQIVLCKGILNQAMPFRRCSSGATLAFGFPVERTACQFSASNARPCGGCAFGASHSCTSPVLTYRSFCFTKLRIKPGSSYATLQMQLSLTGFRNRTTFFNMHQNPGATAPGEHDLLALCSFTRLRLVVDPTYLFRRD